MNPSWLDRSLYPFEHRRMRLPEGEVHYLDEGAGEPIVFVHGTPTWSFLWRRLVIDLRDAYRCVAPDHLGFGLSDKPPGAGYRPADHSARLEAFIEGLGLRDVTLVVHDFGGPIGLGYAVRRPANVARVVVMNTWMWSNEGNRGAETASRLLGGPLGRFLYTRLDLSTRFLLPAAFADRTKLTPAVHRHYRAPFASPADRVAPWTLAGELTGSNGEYDALWRGRDALAGKPMLIVWGTADRLIGIDALRRWRAAFPGAQVTAMDGVGHFVPEEAPERTAGSVRTFLRSSGG